jgi:hypothetical protein
MRNYQGGEEARRSHDKQPILRHAGFFVDFKKHVFDAVQFAPTREIS